MSATWSIRRVSSSPARRSCTTFVTFREAGRPRWADRPGRRPLAGARRARRTHPPRRSRRPSRSRCPRPRPSASASRWATATPPSSTPAIRCSGGSTHPGRSATVVLVGTFTVRDPDAPVWFGDPSVAEVGIGGTADDADRATRPGLIAPDGLSGHPRSAACRSPTDWRLLVDPATVRTPASSTRSSRTSAGSSGATGPPSSAPGALTGPADRSGCLTSSATSSERATTETVLVVAALGPLGRGGRGARPDRHPRGPPAPSGSRAGAWPRCLGRSAAGDAAVGGSADHGPGGAHRPAAWPCWSSPLGRASCHRSGRSWWRSARPPSCVLGDLAGRPPCPPRPGTRRSARRPAVPAAAGLRGTHRRAVADRRMAPPPAGSRRRRTGRGRRRDDRRVIRVRPLPGRVARAGRRRRRPC